MFEQTFVPSGKGPRWTVLAAALGQLFIVAILVVVPLMYVQVLPAPKLMSEILTAPPPLAPPPPPAAPPTRPKAPKIVARNFNPTQLTVPITIPKQLTIPSNSAPILSPAPDIAVGVAGGIPGGIAGGTLGGILNSVPSPEPPPPPVAAAPAPLAPPSRVRVGGNVEAALLLHRVIPSYPSLASQAHIAGTVRLKAVIGLDGKVENLSLISGHPLLIQAAEAAVKQWIYKPTLLNGQPVEVDTEIDINFVTS